MYEKTKKKQTGHKKGREETKHQSERNKARRKQHKQNNQQKRENVRQHCPSPVGVMTNETTTTRGTVETTSASPSNNS